jgi:hypothetical protein
MEMAQQRDAMAKQAAGDWARGVAVYADKPEFAQKWAEGLDDLHARGLMPTPAYQGMRNAPSPLVLQQIIAQTTDPRLAFQQKQADRELGLQSQRFEESKRQADRQFGLESEKFNLAKSQAEEKPAITWQKDQNDVPQPYLQDPKNKANPVTPLKIPGGTDAPGNPFAVGGPMKEHEGKSALFADRAATAHEAITKFENINRGATGFVGGVAEKTPYIGEPVMNIVGTSERGQFMNAKRSFINALLRRESGAAIAAGEFSSYDKEYFPQPGDDAKQIEQKRLHRAEVINGLAREAGKSYRPQFLLTEDGRVVKTKDGKPVVAGAPPPAGASPPAPAGGVVD